MIAGVEKRGVESVLVEPGTETAGPGYVRCVSDDASDWGGDADDGDARGDCVIGVPV